MSLRDGIDLTPGGFPYRQHPHRYCGSSSDRQSVGDPGHCEDCCSVGHIVAHPDLGCADVQCNSDHADKPITYAGPTGREKPGEHWNARILREQREADQGDALPDQPDGIADDSTDLPHPADAAERVRAYIEATGDGLYDSTDGHPLYARDLESIRRAALGVPLIRRGGASA